MPGAVRQTLLMGLEVFGPFLYAGIAAALLVPFGFAPGWWLLGLCLASYAFAGVGEEMINHRYFSHGAFSASKPVHYALTVWAAVTNFSPYWAAKHRIHHAHSDQPGDPHSPRLIGDVVLGNDLRSFFRGSWHAIQGTWAPMSYDEIRKQRPDLVRDTTLMAIANRCNEIQKGYFVLLGLCGWVLQGHVAGFVWGYVAAGMAMTRLALFGGGLATNTLAHWFGSRPFRSSDGSGDIFSLSLVSMGMSIHNTHHAFPFTAYNNLRGWWVVDPSGWVIWVGGKLGLFKNIKVPPAAWVNARRRNAMRASVALQVRIGDRDYGVRDISLTGVSLEAQSPGDAAPASGRVALTISAPSMDGEVKVSGDVLASAAGAGPLRIAFVDAEGTTRELLTDLLKRAMAGAGSGRRRSARGEIMWNVLSKTDNKGVIDAVLHDISAGGAALWMPHTVPVGSAVSFEVVRGGGLPVRFDGVATRVEEKWAGMAEVGVRFDESSAEAIAILEEAVAMRRGVRN